MDHIGGSLTLRGSPPASATFLQNAYAASHLSSTESPLRNTNDGFPETEHCRSVRLKPPQIGDNLRSRLMKTPEARTRDVEGGTVLAPTKSDKLGDSDQCGRSSSTFTRARAGDRSALNRLVDGLSINLRRWAQGRLPLWARRGIDTADLVHEALLRTIAKLDRFEPRHKNALRAYLRQTVQNRIVDEIRRARRYEQVAIEQFPSIPSAERGPYRQLVDEEDRRRFAAALGCLRPSEQKLIVARFELGYSYEQIALLTGKRSPDAARVALKRALVRLAEAMALPGQRTGTP
jgi:RNA polymerase sigma-70 factor, ECF subfamily